MFTFKRIYHRIEINFWWTVIPLLRESSSVQWLFSRAYAAFTAPRRWSKQVAEIVTFSVIGLVLGLLLGLMQTGLLI